ncbi:MAG: hypothetical protein M3O50_01095 [Myxococcota bacterium]|nr:hypothetical protein [Myxococcota bacterium]
MVAASFDPTHAVRFDLPHGTVRAAGEDEALLLIPAAALNGLARSAVPEAVEALGLKMGSALGRRVALRMIDPHGASVEEFVTELAGQAALCGLGALSIERWGRALVVTLEQSPLDGAIIGPLVAAAIEAAAGTRVWCAVLSVDDRASRIFVGSHSGVTRVREWLASGLAWGAVVARLHGVGT